MPKSAPRVGDRMLAVTSYVALHPGCPKIEPAEAVGPHGSRHYGYNAVDRALRAGLIEHRPGAGPTTTYHLFVTEAGRAALIGTPQ